MARSNPKLDKIYEIFDKHGVDIDKDSIWQVQGTPVVKHKDVERLGAKLGVIYDVPKIIRAERDEAVIMVIGRIGERMEWSIGEALIVQEGQIGGNYKVSGKQAAYVYAMSEKRAKDRVILKLADLHGDAYSEEEADEFKGGGQRNSGNDNIRKQDEPAQETKTLTAEEAGKIVDEWLDKIDSCATNKEVMDLVGDAQFKADLKALHPDDEKDLKEAANKRSKYLMKNKDKAASDAA